MFYGSTLITPALSVLSAVEGLNVATDAFAPYVLPMTVIILVALFSVQSHGTARVSALFAPITTVWFIVMPWPARLRSPPIPGCSMRSIRITGSNSCSPTASSVS